MTEAVETLPRAALIRVGGEVKTLARSIERTLLEIRQLPAPMADPAVAHEIAFLQDLVWATTTELDALPRADGPLSEQIVRVDRLTAMAGNRLRQLDAEVDAWAEHGRRSIVTIEEQPDALIVRSIDRLIYDGARAVGIVLFLCGLLFVGFRLLTAGEGTGGMRHAFRQTSVRSSLGSAAIALFMMGSFGLGLRPEVVMDLSAHTQVQPRQDACRSLVVQRQQLWAAQELSSPQLIAAVEQRMEGVANDCLGLDTETAAAEAVMHYATPPAAPGEKAPGGPRPAGLGSDLSRDLNRLVQASEARAAELPDAAGPGQARDRGAAGVAAGHIQEMTANEAIEEAQTGAAADQPQAASAARPPAGPQPLLPMPPEPAPRQFVTTTALNYRAGPSRSAPRLGTLARGTSVHMVAIDDGWSIVRLEDGRSVYVASDFLERMK